MTSASRSTADLQRRLEALEAEVADLRRSRDASRQQAEMLSITLASISDPVFITDAHGAFTYICPNVERALGYNAQEVERLGTVEALLDEPIVSIDELRRAGEISNLEHRARDKFGRWHDLLINVKYISLGSGTALYVCRDITERNEALERARELRDELTHVSRVATLGEFATGLAHELNQPLTAIANYANGCQRALATQRASTEELTRILASLAAEAERAGQIVHRLRGLVRKDAPRRRIADLNHVARDVLSLAQHDAQRRDVDLRPLLANEPLLALMDTVQIQQVVLNLVRNACDSIAASGRGGAVDVATRRGHSRVELLVTDDGPGVPADVATRLFDPFFTTKRGGIGMGLTISRSIIEDHGGTLTLRRAAGPGACFAFTLPEAAEGPR